MKRLITTDQPEHLYGDGRYATEAALKDAIATIDRHLGDGYAARNPALVGTYLQAAVAAGTMINHDRILEGIAQGLCDALDGIAAAVSPVS